MKQLFTVKDLSSFLQVCPNTYRWTDEGMKNILHNLIEKGVLSSLPLPKGLSISRELISKLKGELILKEAVFKSLEFLRTEWKS